MSYQDDSITYHHGRIMDVADAIGQFEGFMDGTLTELYQEFKKLFAADWSGQAGQACDAAQQKWNTGATEIKAALGQVGTKLGASSSRIAEIDQQLAQLMEQSG